MASSSSLKASAFTFRNRLKNKKFNQVYTKKAKAFETEDFVLFLVGLRNYVQHIKTPIICSVVHVNYKSKTKPTLQQELDLNKVELLTEWDKWSPKAKKFIEGQRSLFPVKRLLEKYQKIVKTFYLDIYKAILEIYAADIKKLKKMDKEIKKLEGRLSPK